MHGYPWICSDTHGYPWWISMEFDGYPWISMVIIGYPRISTYRISWILVVVPASHQEGIWAVFLEAQLFTKLVFT